MQATGSMTSVKAAVATGIALLAWMLGCAGLALAQQATPRPASMQPATAASTAEQRGHLVRQDAQVTRAAGQVMHLVDANRIGEVWDGASAVTRQRVGREDFIRRIEADRARLGAVSARANPVVTRTQFPAGGEIPEGHYISVAMATHFVGQPQPIRELVSFRLDEDGTLRVSGYTLRAAEPAVRVAPPAHETTPKPASKPASKP